MKLADDTKTLRGYVQIDDVYWGGKRHGGKRGRGAEGKIPFVAALQRNTKSHPTFIRFSRVEGFSSSEMLRWGQKHLKPRTIVISDGLACFKSFQAIGHLYYPVITSGRYNSPDFKVFDWINTIMGNVKNTIKGTYHGLDHRHLPRYLGEFCFRFIRRFKLKRLLESRIYYSSKIGPIPERQLRIAEDWW